MSITATELKINLDKYLMLAETEGDRFKFCVNVKN